MHFMFFQGSWDGRQKVGLNQLQCHLPLALALAHTRALAGASGRSVLQSDAYHATGP